MTFAKPTPDEQRAEIRGWLDEGRVAVLGDGLVLRHDDCTCGTGGQLGTMYGHAEDCGITFLASVVDLLVPESETRHG